LIGRQYGLVASVSAGRMNVTRNGRTISVVTLLYKVLCDQAETAAWWPCGAARAERGKRVSNRAVMSPRAVGGVVAWSAAVAMLAAVGACTTPRGDGPAEGDLGIPACPASALGALLSPDALQCWLDAPNGRWRIVGHESVHRALVVHVVAAQLHDAEAIAHQLVDTEGRRFVEILVYVDSGTPAGRGVTRRVRWAPERGFDLLEFAAGP
jgi:hypothetical protein